MTPRGTTFRETMLGRVRLADDGADRRVRLDLLARADRLMLPHRTTRARLTGRIRIAGRADDPAAEGELEISPVARRRIRYRLGFDLEGRRLLLDGWKSVSLRRPLSSMTVLPYTLYEDGARVGEGTLRFPLATGLLPFLAGFRFPRAAEPAADRYLAPRWDGTPGRTEVWYTTLTDPATGSGVWLHHELVAPRDGGPAHAHGWVAVFPKEGPVEHARFGPVPWEGGPRDGWTGRTGGPADGFVAGDVAVAPGRLTGSAGPFSWALTEEWQGPPLHTFPRWSWRRPWLPATHLLPAARARYSGTVRHGTRVLRLTDAPGAGARIFGHGNARRWAWLHADLGGGDVLEIVAAVSMRRGLDRLPPLVFLRLYRNGRTWPRRAERTAVGWAGIGLPRWRVEGRAGLRRIKVTVTQPPDGTLALDYTDPDGSAAVCRNSERADAEVRVERWWGRWRPESAWRLSGTAHAEVGGR
ncbi:tocopherol cyclase family protein [Streptomyces sp. NPDC004658]|uniref:tocopherol cyclase family protein n=1 Tax=Streptomyces sp. NPDC004658 TaxID=3154672 RepID=UPI00339F453F